MRVTKTRQSVLGPQNTLGLVARLGVVTLNVKVIFETLGTNIFRSNLVRACSKCRSLIGNHLFIDFCLIFRVKWPKVKVCQSVTKTITQGTNFL